MAAGAAHAGYLCSSITPVPRPNALLYSRPRHRHYQTQYCTCYPDDWGGLKQAEVDRSNSDGYMSPPEGVVLFKMVLLLRMMHSEVPMHN